MRVYLIAAPEDEVEADKLASYLKRFGVFIRAEYGKFAYPPAQHGEFTLALWSRNAMMSTRQMMLTNRAIDAWAEGQLVMARLEHGLNPRGLSDLEMVDLTFEAAREHRYRDVLTALRALEDERRRALQTDAPPQDLPGGGSGGGEPSEDLEEVDDWEGGRAYPVEDDAERTETPSSSSRGGFEKRGRVPTAPTEPVTKSSGGTGLFGVILVLLGGVGLTVAVWQGYLTWQVGAMIAGGLLVAVMFLNILLAALRGSGDRPTKAKRRSAPMPELAAEAPSPAPVMTEAPNAPAAVASDDEHEVFVSYSHQNAETVLPIVETVEAKGLSIWIDKEEMRAGQGWAGQIVRAIKSAERFCLMCSEQAFESDHVRREVYLADKYGKAMVPIKLDGAEMPEDIEYFLAGRQWVDLTSLSEEERAAVIHGALSETPN